MFNTRLSVPVVVCVLVCCTFPFIPNVIYALFGASSVRIIENSQALILLSCAIFTYFYMHPEQLQGEKKIFWLWAIAWWILLFGRSISWGRDYFPDVPKVYFRTISVVLIGTVVFMLFSPQLRSAIAQKIRTLSISIWAFGLALMSLFISHMIEEHHAIASIWVFNPIHNDLMEELYEYPLLLALFLIAWPMMKQDRLALNDSNSSESDFEDVVPDKASV